MSSLEEKMKQARGLALCCLGVLLGAGVMAQSPRSLKLGSATASLGQTAGVAVTLDTDAQVQGLVIAAEWSPAKLQGMSLVSGAALTTNHAQVVVPRIEAGYAVLGVVMDSDGQGGEILPAGNGQVIATLQVKCLGPAGDTPEDAPVTFADGKYNTA